MTSALIAEYRKFFSTRMWWVLLLAMVAYLGFMALVMSFSMTSEMPGEQGPQLSGADAARTVYSLTSPIGYVFALVVGSLAVTNEFRHKTITTTLLVGPDRNQLIGAKLISSIPMGLAYGIVATAAVVGIGAPMLSFLGDGAFLGEGETITLLLFSVVVFVLWTAMGVAFGTMVPNQVAAIVILLAFTQFVEPIARVGLGSFDATSSIAKFLPGAAADATLGTSFYGAIGGTSGDLLSRPTGVLVMIVYILLFATIGRMTTFRRDIA